MEVPSTMQSRAQWCTTYGWCLFPNGIIMGLTEGLLMYCLLLQRPSLGLYSSSRLGVESHCSGRLEGWNGAGARLPREVLHLHPAARGPLV